MTFSIAQVAAKDGTGATITGGVDFVDTSGTGAGPYIIAKATIDPAGTNTQAILSNSAAKTDLSSVAGTATATGHGTAAGSIRVELPTDGTGLVNAAQSGTWTVQPGNTANTTAWKVDGSAVTQPVSGTVTANAGTNLNTSALALDTSVNGVLVSQGSTTSGEKGPLIQGAVTTSAPSYTTAQTSPISLNTAGGLRVDGSGVTQPVSGTVTTTPPSNASTNVAQFGGTNVSTGTGAGGAGIPRVTISNDSSLAANQSVNLAQVAGATVSYTNLLPVQEPDAANAAAVAGTGNASVSSATVIWTLDTTGYNGIAVQVTSAGSATVTYQASNDNATWVAINGYSPAATGTPVSTSTTTGIINFPIVARYFRANVTSYTSGTVTAYYALRRTFAPYQSSAIIGNATLLTQPQSISTGGATTATVEAAASTNSTNTKGSAGQVYNFNFGNSAAYDVYFKFYNKATAPTVGTDAVFYKIKVPSGGRADGSFPVGIVFGTGIGYGITKLEADSDTTVVVAGDINGGFGYK